ncbi:AAA family ATPase [bacterium]|nr:AAA family ATPase [bacterium]
MQNLSVYLVEKDTTALQLLKMYLKELDYIDIIGENETLEAAHSEIIKTTPDIVIANISDNINKNYEMTETILKRLPSVKIIAMAADYSTDTIIRAMRAGIREFLPKPIIKDNLLKSIDKFKNQILGDNTDENNSKVLTIFSNKGGVGKTSIAVNLALELANITKEKVALVDLNMHLGDVTTFLDIKPSFDISYLVKKIDSADEEFMLSTLEQYNNTGMYVLADPPYMEEAKKIQPNEIQKTINKLRTTFPYIIIDTNSTFDAITVTALDNSDLILLVSAINVPAVRNCQRCLDAFDRLGYEEEKTKIIVNRYMENDDIKIEDVEKAIDKPVYWRIPNNYYTITSAICKGKPVSVINNDSNIAKSYRELATNISDNIYRQSVIKKINRNPLAVLENLI